ncbi:ubiquitin-like modifier-activating enzyme ATG7 [Cryptococcus neoformans Tu259-1]|uniref:Ubiquitin-like modifier-activating enzyme ATG7 n=1 Tax=Cryptococcus neoformans Tu259-1 TaxID=1230072 RepID=A0A854Q8U3_CRYNE|nr:ubiquitin-like modifier-activating enzyme ATG7 [Cryptococcus neoformans var. grubii Tu259-1]
MAPLQFQPLASQPTPAFWAALAAHKLNHLRLDDSHLSIAAHLEPAKRVLVNKEHGHDSADVGIDGSLVVGGEAFEAERGKLPLHTVSVSGTLKIFNTIEEFKDTSTKKRLFDDLVAQMLESFDTDQPILNPFLLVTFADLKKYVYHYWFAFPALVSNPAWVVDGEFMPVDEIDEIRTFAQSHFQNNTTAFLVKGAASQLSAAPLSSCPTFYDNGETVTVVFHDTSSLPSNPGWTLRNVLYYLSAKHGITSLRVICLREGSSSIQASLSLPASPTPTPTPPQAVGWERHPSGKLSPRVADLGPMMDPTRLASQAVDLNLKLIKWRLLPALDLDKISGTKCLLLGAGTLGCYVARILMGWGVRNMTLVDSSTVSYSNPVRQPLFTFSDCLNGGLPKAPTAAKKLQEIFPGVNAQGVVLGIPMPGHPISSDEDTSHAVAKLEALVESHDAVFLLMDSRESRWLPTVMGKKWGKVVVNAALGFDSFLVMRHGAGAQSDKLKEMGKKGLGCYYCNDIVAPTDSLSDRTLDQMCTVTRPGVAPIAAAMAVELLISVLQHPLGVHAPAERPDTMDINPTYTSPLGCVPHQLRGQMYQWKTQIVEGEAFDRCTACSDYVLNEYETKGFAFLRRVFNEKDYLEKVTGLDELYRESEKVIEGMEGLDWDSEGEE